MDLLSKIRGVVTRAVVDLRDSAGRYQVLWGGDRASAGVEHLETQGVHFAAPGDADALLIAPAGDKSAAVLIGMQGAVPGDSLPAGAGGLHYLGEWRVFVSDDGTVHLGSREPGDFAARASLVDAELAAIKADLDALKTAYDGHTHLYSPGPSAPAPSAPPATPAPTPHSPDPVGSEIVRIE